MAAVGLVFSLNAAIFGMRGVASQEKMNKEVSQGAKDLRALNEKEQEELSKYGWIDQSAGKVRIPIERAMELVIIEAHKKSPYRSRIK